MPDDPLILALALHPDDQARFERLRRLHFPPTRNLVPAHVTLFHHLPGEEGAMVQHVVAATCARQAAFEVDVIGLRSLGRGVAFVLESATLAALRGGLARAFHGMLTAQDRQPYRPHLTVQNKAEPSEARRLLAELQAGFAPFAVRAAGLDVWRYRGGPWEHAGLHRFG